MSHVSTAESNRPRMPRFSLGSLLLLTTVVCLAISLVILYKKYSQAEQQLNAMLPMSVEDVARKFENSTKFGTTTTKVTDVRYSPTENAYKVQFSWTDAKTGQDWSANVKLTPDGFGVFYGKIYNPEFLRAVGSNNEYYMVAVETPSPLNAK
jgi:hypothetical protein